eukprot:804519-Amphidinium_carterae.1
MAVARSPPFGSNGTAMAAAQRAQAAQEILSKPENTHTDGIAVARSAPFGSNGTAMPVVQRTHAAQEVFSKADQTHAGDVANTVPLHSNSAAMPAVQRTPEAQEILPKTDQAHSGGIVVAGKPVHTNGTSMAHSPESRASDVELVAKDGRMSIASGVDVEPPESLLSLQHPGVVSQMLLASSRCAQAHSQLFVLLPAAVLKQTRILQEVAQRCTVTLDVIEEVPTAQLKIMLTGTVLGVSVA